MVMNKPVEKKQMPEKTIRYGNVSATIWTNKLKDGTEVKNVVIEKNYMDEKEEWHTTSQYGRNDLSKVILAAHEAQKYLFTRHEEKEE